MAENTEELEELETTEAAEETEEEATQPADAITPVQLAKLAELRLHREVSTQSMFAKARPNKSGRTTIQLHPDSKSSREGGNGILFDRQAAFAWLRAQENGSANTQRGQRMSQEDLDALVAEFEESEEDAE